MEVANATFVVAAENFVIRYFNEYVIAQFKDLQLFADTLGGWLIKATGAFCSSTINRN